MAFPSYDQYTLLHSPGAGCLCPGCLDGDAAAGGSGPVGQSAGRLFFAYDTDTGDDDQGVDALVSGSIWNTTALSYSFPDSASDYGAGTANGESSTLGALNATQQDAARLALAQVAEVSGLSFTEIAGADDGQADIRWAESSAPATAWAYYPSNNANGGDIWFNPTSYNSPTVGSYAYATFVHELGHALGLKHGHETGGPGAVPAATDSMEYTVMTYRSYVGHDLDAHPYYTNAGNAYAQSPMIYDIAALQRLYGANHATRSGDTVYSVSTATGELTVDGAGVLDGTGLGLAGNTVFRTIWDGGGTDTYDFSAYTTDLAIDLAPGGHVDLDVGGTFQRADISRFGDPAAAWARGHVFNALLHEGDVRSLIENATGGSGNDTLMGNAGDNRLAGGAGDDVLHAGDGVDTLEGGAGTDTAVFALAFASYAFALDGAALSVTGAAVASVADTVEALAFSDRTMSFAEIVAGLDTSDPPVAADDTASVTAGQQVLIDVLANDSDPDGDELSIAAVGTPAAGTAEIDGDRILYTAPAAFSGTVQIAYTASDGNGGTDDATVTVTVAPAPLDLTGTAGADHLLGGAFGDTLTGLGGDDTLWAFVGDDSLSGGSGNDSLDGGEGADTLDGGAGIDTLLGGGGADLIRADGETPAPGGAGDLALGGGGGDTVLGSTGGDVVYGEAGDDSIEGLDGVDILFGNDGSDTLSGGGGGDVLIGEAGTDSLLGGSGNDLAVGGADGDTILGGSGDDFADAGEGADRVEGGAGADIVLARGGDDTVSGGAGADQVLGGSGHDLLTGGGEADLLFGEAGDDTVLGEDGDDVLFGNAGADSLSGGSGADAVIGEAGADTLEGGGGDDLLGGGTEGDALSGGAGADLLDGEAGDDLLDGGTEDDILFGRGGADTLTGGAGADFLLGGSESDEIRPGTGADSMAGEAGADVFVLEAGDGVDVLFDFDPAEDVIRFASGPADFAALAISTDVSGAARVAYDGAETDVLLLYGVAAGDLADTGMFLFG